MHLSGFEILAILAIGFQSSSFSWRSLSLRCVTGVETALRRLWTATMFDRILETLADSNASQVRPNGGPDQWRGLLRSGTEGHSKAKRSVNLEAYIFQREKSTRRFVDAITERARAGVKVNIVLDAIGSFATWNSYFKELKEAGGRVEWYHGFKWHQLPRLNSRTHREFSLSTARWRSWEAQASGTTG